MRRSGHTSTDLGRHIYLRAFQDTNEILFYRLLLNHIEEMLPIVYTPTVGQACQQFSHIYRRNRGLFVSYPHRDDIRTLLRNRPNREVDVIVVTDGERILGIGDQGAGGMGIPIGKLSLYTLVGGIHPSRTLPVVLDVGTNNPERRDDPEYIGWRHERVTGQAYLDFVERFVQAVQAELPTTLLQWEDFATPHARPILERYRDQLLTFNDDIQGTAAVTLGAILGAVSVTGKRLPEQQVVFLGAGSAAIGVADYLRAAMVQEGISEQEARSRLWLVDKDGLLHTGRGDLTPEQRVYAQPIDRVANWPRTSDGKIGLADVIGQVEATILIGLSTVGGAFTEPIVREMARKAARPVIFPLSNPTARSEAKPQDLIQWTGGQGVDRDGLAVCAGRLRGAADPDRPVQQRVHFPGGRARGDRLRGPPRHGWDDAGRRPCAGRELPGPEEPVRLAPARRPRPAHRGRRDRDGCRPGGPAGRVRVQDQCRGVRRPSCGQPVDAGVFAARSRRMIGLHHMGTTTLRYLELWKTDKFSDVSLAQWLAFTPYELVKAHLNIDKSVLAKVSTHKTPVVPG